MVPTTQQHPCIIVHDHDIFSNDIMSIIITAETTIKLLDRERSNRRSVRCIIEQLHFGSLKSAVTTKKRLYNPNQQLTYLLVSTGL